MVIPRDSVEMSELHPAYVAGFIDGEGCIRIDKSFPVNRSVHYKLQVIVVNTNEEILQALREQYGGYSQRHEFKGKVAYYWSVYGTPATNLLKEIQPYLRVKRAQADVALEFQDAKTLGKPSAGVRLSNEELELREGYYQKIKALKSTKPVTTTKGRLNETMV